MMRKDIPFKWKESQDVCIWYKLYVYQKKKKTVKTATGGKVIVKRDMDEVWSTHQEARTIMNIKAPDNRVLK